MKKIIKVQILFIWLISQCFSCTETRKTVVDTATETTTVSSDKTYTFDTAVSWQDNFDINGNIDQTKWGYDLGGSGWGNNELQNYTDVNGTVSNGNLVITTKKESSNGKDYSSTRLVSRGKGDFLYGRFVFRAKLPQGKGTWPAIWMLPTENAFGIWPKSGEIDIMESVGFDPNKLFFTIHTLSYNGSSGTQKGVNKTFEDIYNTYHIYRLDWTPYSLKFFTDDVQVFEYLNDGKGYASWPFNKKFYILINNAVGGNWGGQQGIDNSIFPTTMTVDYVKVYNCTNCN
ncbi:MAG: glycoside hydrolase family 16 protein [Sediminibacterium sp.]|nr:glycoside hydrolase family 16 protein [Sediminibacterium sp.]